MEHELIQFVDQASIEVTVDERGQNQIPFPVEEFLISFTDQIGCGRWCHGSFVSPKKGPTLRIPVIEHLGHDWRLHGAGRHVRATISETACLGAIRAALDCVAVQ